MNHSAKCLIAAVSIMAGGNLCASAQTDISTRSNEWIEVTLESAGSLGVEVLYKVDVLDDVTDLKVTGPLNDNDWTTLRNMSNLVNLDLSGATASWIPRENFRDRKSLTTFLAPMGLKSIGEQAFYSSGLKEITIPETVKSVDQYAFHNCSSLEKAVINGSATLAEYAFQNCSNLTNVEINGDVSTIDQYCFNGCKSLENITLPESLTYIGSYAFNSTALTDIVFPDNLQSIGYYAFAHTPLTKVVLPFNVDIWDHSFYDCSTLTEVTLPGTYFTYYRPFESCKNIKKVICPAGTPPGRYNNSYDPFQSVSKAGITLVVPEFAVVNYKLDSYWKQFGTIEGGAQSDCWAINSELAMTNNRRFEGKPSLDIMPSGKLTVGGAAPMDLSAITFHHSVSNYNNKAYSQLINNCPSMTAGAATMELNCDNGQWYYLAMPCNVKMADIRHSAGSDFVFRYYDGESRASKGTGSSWKDVPADGVLEAGKGYIYQSYSEGTLILSVGKDEASALLASGDRTTPVSAWASENQANAGWNLIGNPYMSYYNLAESTLSCPVTVWNQSRRTYEAYSLIDDVVVISPMQAFFIQQTDADGEITFAGEGRTFTSNSSPAAYAARRAEATGRRVFDITVGTPGNDWADRTRVVVNPDASLGYESACDASKFFADNNGLPALYTLDTAGNRLAINERPADNGVVRLGVYLPAAGTYSIAIGRADGEITLQDNLTGKNALISSGEPYSFTSDEAGNIDQRFTLTVGSNGTDGIIGAQAGEAAFNVTTGASAIAVSGPEGAKVAVYATDGRLVAESVISSTGCRFAVAEGLYIVRCAGNAVKCVVK